ncbi:MAG: HAMP domain-containing protein [Planctomycetota bacterium]|nr:HAMP domain-containing protein [Planctomycetota bacterium]
MKLATKVVVVFLLAVMVLTVIQGVVAVHHERELFRLEQEEQARSFTSDIEDLVLDALHEQQHEKIAEILKQKQSNRLATQVRWVRFDATASVRDGTVGEIQLQNIRRGELVSFETRQGSESMLNTYYAIDSAPPDQGVLHFSRPLAPLEQRNRDTIFRTFYLLGAMGLLSVLVIGLAGMRIIGRPLQQLIDKTQRIGAGDLTMPLDLHSRDELGQLATDDPACP